MADTQQQTDEQTVKTAPAAPAPDAAVQPVAAAPPAVTPEKLAEEIREAKPSKGEKLYNWSVYSGINYWINLGMSLVIADYFTHGKGQKNLMGLAKKMGGANEKSIHSAKVGLEQLALNSGGWLLLVPMKIMEDRKRPIVHWLNEKLGVNQTAPDGHKETADEIYIDQEQPHQGWMRVIGRRTLASGSTIVSGMILDRGFEAKRDKPIMVDGKLKDTIGGKDRFTNYMVDKTNVLLKSGFVPGGKKLAEKEWVQRYLGLAALDVINTKITAGVMHITNGAKRGRAPKEIGDDFDPPVVQVSPDQLTAVPLAAIASTPKSLDEYKSKKILPVENHTDLAKHSDAGRSLSS